MKRKHIVIAGVGFAGLNAYKSLPRWISRSADITLIDQKNHFLFTPLLHEVASASLDDMSVVEPFRDIIRPSHTFIQGFVDRIDPEKNTLYLNEKEIPYDILVSSFGSTTNTFGIKGVDEYSFTLKTLEDAVVLRNHCIDIFEKASQIEDNEERKKLLSFVIVGGGPTGVELAGEFSELFFKTLVRKHKNIHPRDISLTLVNAGSSLLSTFPKRLQDYAENTLRLKNVIVRNDFFVTEVQKEALLVQDGSSLDAHTIVWTAGVRAQEFNLSGVEAQYQQGKIVVDPSLLVSGSHNIFAAGDMSFLENEEGGLPMTAQVAKQQGIHIAKNIGNLIKGKELRSFSYKESGVLASLGFLDAVASIGKVKFMGFPAWILWRAIYLFNFSSWKKRFRVLIDWIFNAFTGRETTRL